MPRNSCPTCNATKDVRAVQCLPCQRRDRPQRLGTGTERRLAKSGYVLIMRGRKEHYEHRFLMEQQLGRKLKAHEHVHHKNSNRSDNRLENLEVLDSSEHHREHLPSDRAKEMSVLGHAARWGYEGESRHSRL